MTRGEMREHCGTLCHYARDILLLLRHEDKRIIAANEAALAAYGYDYDELLSLTIADLRTPEENGAAEAQLARAASEGVMFETVHRRRDGNTFPVEVNAQPAHVDGQRAIVNVIRDISERKQAEAEIRAAAENYRALFDAANDAIFVHDPETGCIVDVNRKGTETYGYNPTEVCQLTVGDISAGIPPYTQEDARQHIQKAAAGEPQVFEWLAKDRHGRTFWVEVSLKRATIAGQPRLLAIMRDIDDRKRAEEERERLLGELEATISSIPDAVIVYDTQGKIQRLNPAAQAMLRYPRAEREKPFVERAETVRVETPEGKPFPLEETPTLRALRGEVVQGVIAVIHLPPGGVIWANASAAPVRGAEGHLLGAVLTLVDITAQHEQQEQREDFNRMVSHDLRQPLTVIQGHVQLLQGELPKAEPPNREQLSLQAIDVSATRMDKMIQELVEAARLETGHFRLEPRPLDLLPYVRDLVRRLGGAIPAERLQIEAPAEVPPVLADPDRLERVLGNLIDNALKHSPTEAPVVVRLGPGADEVVVSVIDRGPGIPPEDLPHIFQRYYRATARQQRRAGLGLGLYIARLIAEAHGGRIWAESTPGQGSTFSFTLPLAK
ncbi:MAG: PAS domain S-box protein [Dehalococcoidales bacterium]|nr:PAS domain S-box protein [Dehalococcoidales bacterium]